MARVKRDRKGTRRDRSLWAREIADQWGGLRPILSPEESLAAAKKLWRHAVGKSWSGKWALTSGRRSSRPLRGVFYVNPDERGERGLRELIHSISHVAHQRLHPNDAPHSIRQVQLESRLTKFAISRRWHEGSLKRPEKVAEAPAPKPSLKERREARRVAALARALHRLKLAQAAVDRLSGKPKRRKRKAKAKPAPSYEARKRAASRKLSALARLYPEAFEIEREVFERGQRANLAIWPGDWLEDDDDPSQGDHYFGSDSVDALELAEKYVAMWQERQKGIAA